MAAIVEELTIKAAPQRVWKAITQQDEIIRWWAYEARVKPEVGSLGEFRFRPPAGTFHLEVAELDPDKKVRWITRQAPAPQWAGTSITWQLTPVQSGTQVAFTHDGFTQADVAFEAVHKVWQYFLVSLTSYLETGKGTPGTPPDVR